MPREVVFIFARKDKNEKFRLSHLKYTDVQAEQKMLSTWDIKYLRDLSISRDNTP